jgi:3-O-methylgallate 3,4-dioxygenase
LSRDLPNQATARRCYELGLALRRHIESWPPGLRIGLIASGGLSHQIIDEELDQTVIGALVAGDDGTMRALPRDRLNRAPGTPEILNWVAVAAAMAPTRMTLVDYLPCYRSLAGTGHGLTFGSWE